MKSSVVYRRLAHNFFDGRLTAAELREKCRMMMLRQGKLFTYSPHPTPLVRDRDDFRASREGRGEKKQEEGVVINRS